MIVVVGVDARVDRAGVDDYHRGLLAESLKQDLLGSGGRVVGAASSERCERNTAARTKIGLNGRCSNVLGRGVVAPGPLGKASCDFFRKIDHDLAHGFYDNPDDRLVESLASGSVSKLAPGWVIA